MTYRHHLKVSPATKNIVSIMLMFLLSSYHTSSFIIRAHADEIPVEAADAVPIQSQDPPAETPLPVSIEPTNTQIEPQVAATSETSQSPEGTTTPLQETVQPDSISAPSSTSFEISTSTLDESIPAASTTDQFGFITSSTSTESTTIIENEGAPSGTSTPLQGDVPDIDPTVASSTEETQNATTTQGADTTALGTTTIETGDAVAMANVLNLANVNLVNSTGSIIMAHIHDEPQGDAIDLRSSSPSSSSCSLLDCGGIDSVSVNILADASIDNTITIVATSGENLIDTAGNAIITTGSTFAGLNLINVANTNLIDSNYLLVTLNSFQTLEGDIIFPSLIQFFSPHSASSLPGTVALDQTGTVINNLDVSAQSGENNASDTNASSITTGSTHAVTSLFNNLNSLLLGRNVISLLLKVSGAWTGKLFGAPEGSTFTENGDLRILTIGQPTGTASDSLASVEGTTTAIITNTIHMSSDSGHNTTHNTATSTITTGDAYAAANILNLVNTTVIGRNWILGIINIFGDFNGNIAFGRPDLSLKMQAATPTDIIENGTDVTYTFRITNNGDSTASDSILACECDTTHLLIKEASHPYTEESGKLMFNLGNLAPEETKEITLKATIQEAQPGTGITASGNVSERETDNAPADNSDSVTITTLSRSGGSSGGGGITLPPAPASGGSTSIPSGSGAAEAEMVAVTRLTASTTIVGVGTTAKQVISVRNLTDQKLSSIKFEDILYSTDGREIRREPWDMGEMAPHEEILLSYEVSFGEGAPQGMYTLSSVMSKPGRQELKWENNGTINYIPFSSVGAATSNENSTTAPSATSSIVPPPRTRTGVTPRPRSGTTDEKGSVLGEFIETILPEKLHAETGDTSEETSGSSRNVYPWLLLVPLAIYLARRHYLLRKQAAI